MQLTSGGQQTGITYPQAHLEGLTITDVTELRKQYGRNVLPAEKDRAAWSILVAQFKSPLVYIILVAAAVSLIAGEYSDCAIIMAVVVIDVILGFVQEYQAQQTYTALKTLLKPTATVLRDGTRQELDVADIVPGDLVLLNAGEHVPADGELIESIKLAVDEAILTGESEPVNKTAAVDQSLPAVADQPASAVFMGTTVITGRAMMRVTGTGQRTELGQIAASLREHVEEETPLQARLKAFSATLTRVVVLFTLGILLTGLLMGRGFLDMLRTSIILAVAAVPEGLLIAVTVILVLGMRKILKRNGLVKKLLAVETLGSVTVICTDKTGTLTEGRMRVSRTDLKDTARALQTMVLCNNLEGPVDVALWQYAKGQMERDPQDLVDDSTRLAEELFTSETKFMSTASQLNGERNDYLKGAPEIVLAMCNTAPDDGKRILAQVDEWAGAGLRTLGLAYRRHEVLEDHRGYTWAGLVGMEDPVREGVADAVAVAQRAGVRVKMITGDYRRTAERVAQSIGLMETDNGIMDGNELAQLTDVQLRARVGQTAIFSRIRPHDKLRIVEALQANGEVTAMIGDGVNDAPALKRANIGVVVGSATDVAKETADLILLDSNFRTVVAAVEEGRVIFDNIRKVVAYVLSNSFAEVLAIFGAMLLGWPAPLLVAQILWIHLICDADKVELSNLNRQILHPDARIGHYKADSAAKTLRDLNPAITITSHRQRIDSSNIARIAGKPAIIVDCLDNYETRYLLNTYAMQVGVPLVHGAIWGLLGQVTFIQPPQTPCLRCLAPQPPPKSVFPVLGATPGLVGCIQAMEVLKYLTGVGQNLRGRLLFIDGEDMSVDTLTFARVPNCPACGHLG